ALAAKRPASYLQFYAAMSNIDRGPPEIRRLFDGRSTDFGSYIVGQISAAQPTAVVWHFERPTQWEEWLADRLGAAGGERREFVTPLSATHGIQVVMDWSHRDAVVDVLRELVGEPRETGRGCLALEEIGTRRYPIPTLHIAGSQDSSTNPSPEWLVSGYSTSHYMGLVLPDDQTPIGVRIDGSTDAPTHVHTVNTLGPSPIHSLPSGRV